MCAEGLIFWSYNFVADVTFKAVLIKLLVSSKILQLSDLLFWMNHSSAQVKAIPQSFEYNGNKLYLEWSKPWNKEFNLKWAELWNSTIIIIQILKQKNSIFKIFGEQTKAYLYHLLKYMQRLQMLLLPFWKTKSQ